MSQVAGVKPIKALEYQVSEGGSVKPFGTETFLVDAAMVARLAGR
jgi:hypothetical protein